MQKDLIAASYDDFDVELGYDDIRSKFPGKHDEQIEARRARSGSGVLAESGPPVDELAIELQITGAPPLLFGMTRLEATNAMREWGSVQETYEEPGGASRLRVRDVGLTRDIFANLDKGQRVTSVEVWRPEPGASHVSVLFDDIDIFGLSADDVMESLRQRGFEIDDSDPFFPWCRSRELAIGLSREGGDDVDEIADDGLSLHVRSVLVAPSDAPNGDDESWRL